MLIYWLLYLMPVSMALFVNNSRKLNLMPWYFIGFFFIIIIGFRDQVGCDWFRYVTLYERTVDISLFDAFKYYSKDPANTFVNWAVGKWGVGIYGVNFIYAIIFVIGLIKLSRTFTYPWLAMAVSVPYMVVMVSMGYTRQAVALGLFMIAITYIQKGKFKSYIVWVLMATLFHKSAILLLPFGLFLAGRGILLRIVIILPVLYGAWDLLLADKQEKLVSTYIEGEIESSGAKIRVFMNFIPAILLLIYRKKWKKNYTDYSFWFWIAIGAVISTFLVGFASTAVDRVALYFIPIQLAVFARLPYLAKNRIPVQITKAIIIVGYALVLFVWLVFATHSHCWVPYQNIIFQTIV